MKCPTCENAVEGQCCFFRREGVRERGCIVDIPPEQQELQPDPFDATINEDLDEHLYCPSCYHEREQDI